MDAYYKRNMRDAARRRLSFQPAAKEDHETLATTLHAVTLP